MSDYEYAFGRLQGTTIPFPAAVPSSQKWSRGYRKTWGLMTARMVAGNVAPAWLHMLFRRLKAPRDYAGVWVKDAPSPVIRTWNTDQEFARQRLAGLDPTVIKLVRDVSEVPSALVDEDVIRRQLGTEARFVDLVSAHRIFLCDYSHLGGLDTVAGRYFVPPIALFGWHAGGPHEPARLMPLGIQLGPSSADLRAFPGDEEPWRVAKFLVQVADGVHADVWSHLVQAHFTATPFVLTTYRKLSEEHPVRKVLEPHFQFTLEVNAQFLGRSAQNLYGQVMPFTKGAMATLYQRAWDAWGFDTHAFEADLRSRGLWKDAVLPAGFPYRDDGKLLYDAIHRFADAYVREAYANDAEVLGDVQLGQWRDELAGLGKIRGLEPIRTVEHLVEVVRDVLMHFGPQHAAVHSPAAAYGIFAPNMSTAAWAAPPIGSWGDVSLEDFLPPKRKLYAQFMLHYAISEVSWGQFLGYSDRFSPQERALADALTGALVQAEDEIRRRNLVRRRTLGMDYPTLVPANVPNSIYA